MKKSVGKDPIPRVQLPHAGDSNFDEILNIITKMLLAWIIFAFTLSFVITEWIRVFFIITPDPFLMTILLILVTIITFIVLKRNFDNIENYKLGRRGEIYTANILSGTRENGYFLINDIPCVGKNGKKFNIDHVLIGEAGIFSVETKTWRKYGNNENYSKLTYDNGELSYCGAKRGSRPVTQAIDNAKDISNILENRIGRIVKVKPTLLFPGAFINKSTLENTSKDSSSLIISNPIYFVNSLAYMPKVLSTEEVGNIYKSLSSYTISEVEKEIID